MKLIIMTDIHYYCEDWYGISCKTIMERLIKNLKDSYEQEPYEAIFGLGDYSLDYFGNNDAYCYVKTNVSYAKRLKEEYLSQLPCKEIYLIQGNHEQYSEEQWKSITGNPHQFSVVKGNVLFIMLDNFLTNLDPTTVEDGIYGTPDLAFIRQEMDKHPNLPTVLCAHFFDVNGECEEFQSFIRQEDRIVCLFTGHDHAVCVEELKEDYGKKTLIHAGNYSFPARSVMDDPWGFCEVWIEEEGMKVAYFAPPNGVIYKGDYYPFGGGYQFETYISFKHLK